MSHLCVLNSFIVVSSKGNLKAFSSNDGSCVFSYTHSFDKSVMDGNNKPLDEKIEDMRSSPNGEYLCVIYSDKKLLVIHSQKWKILKELTVKRRPTAMSFDRSGKFLFVADKSGDLYKYEISEVVNSDEPENDEEKTQPILGHVSMLLDVEVTTDGKYIITSDRDEKIRVSELENPYVIESYCLGHTEFVCKVEPIPLRSKSLFLSTSGDGTARLWDAEGGKEIGKHLFRSETNFNGEQKDKPESIIRFIPSILACSSDGDFFAVSSTQTGETRAYFFAVNAREPSFRFLADIAIPNCERMVDIKSSQDSKVFYVLGVLGNGGGFQLFAVNCDVAERTLIENVATLEAVNRNLDDLVPESADLYQSMFKARCEGEAYASYHKKKEERLATRRKNTTENGTAGKRVKLEKS